MYVYTHNRKSLRVSSDEANSTKTTIGQLGPLGNNIVKLS